MVWKYLKPTSSFSPINGLAGVSGWGAGTSSMTWRESCHHQPMGASEDLVNC